MGSIVAQNLIREKSFTPSQISVLEKSHKNKLDKVKYLKSAQELSKNYQADLVFICIKPQVAKEILESFSKENIFHKKTIFISILAGKKISFFEEIFGPSAKIIRSMPNLPIEDSQGIFSYMANKNILKSELKTLKTIFEKFGSAFEIKNENAFNAATALFGSGPAYIFLLQEAFSNIAKQHKISKKEADELIKTLFLGSSLMSCNSELNFTKLKDSVTSKGGTTASALEVLQNKDSLEKLFEKAINAASKKSEELSD